MISIVSRTVIRKVNSENPEDLILDETVETIKAGQLAVVPTDTRYGLIADANETRALEKLFLVKGRSLKVPTALFLKSVDEIKNVAEYTERAKKIAEKFLPGKLTMVLKAKATFPKQVVVDGKIGVRVSSSNFLKKLFERIDCPLTATSANPSGQAEPESVEDIARIFGSKIMYYVDGGKLTGEPSTVLDLTEEPFRIIREGAISREEIESVISK